MGNRSFSIGRKRPGFARKSLILQWTEITLHGMSGFPWHPDPQNREFFDLGCGIHFPAALVAGTGRVIGIDVDPESGRFRTGEANVAYLFRRGEIRNQQG